MKEPILPKRLRKEKKKPRKTGPQKQWGLILFTLVMLALVIFGAYHFFIPKQERFTLDFYTYGAVETRDFLETLAVTGTVVPNKVMLIEAKTAGIVEEVFVKEGQDVKEGAPLLRLYSQETVDEKNAAQTELSEAQTNQAQLGIDQELEMANGNVKILDAEKQLSVAESHLELQKILYGYGSIARVELDQAEQDVESARRKLNQTQREQELLIRKHEADRAALQKTIDICRERLEKAEKKIDEFVVKAAISGRILALNIPNNRLVSVHQELGRLADLSSQGVELQVAPGQTERFGPGTPVNISLGQEEYAGEISYIAPQAVQGPDGSTVLVRVDFLEETSHLRPNSAVTAKIHVQLHQDSLFLPRGAYLTSGQQLFVYVLDGKTARRREVRFGLLQGNAVQIISGLELGEEVIISSYDAFRHLEKIEILPEGGMPYD